MQSHVVEHNPIWVTVLPRERRSRHPYQLCVMLWILTQSVSQLVLGLPEVSSLHLITTSQQAALSWYGITSAAAGIAAALIPERIVKWRRLNFDATWTRLITELSGQALLIWVWGSYFLIVTGQVGPLNGFTLGTGAAFWLAVAAGWRGFQIVWTIKRAIVDVPHDAALTGAEAVGLDDRPPGG